MAGWASSQISSAIVQCLRAGAHHNGHPRWAKKPIEMTALTEEGEHGSTPQNRRVLRGDAQNHG
jgi:hypothetical protein